MPDDINIAKPKINIGTTLKWWIAIVCVLFVLIGCGLVYKYSAKQSTVSTLEYASGVGIDGNFYLPPAEVKVVKPPVPAIQNTTVKTSVPIPELKKAAPQPSTVNKMYNPVVTIGNQSSVVARVESVESLDSFDKKRRGSATLRHAVKTTPSLESNFRREAAAQKKAWPEEARSETSAPIDMSRIITVDKNIPALLVNAINSELPGKVTAVIEHNVYGGHGRKVLIPAGAHAIGQYIPLQKVGDERLTISWLRLITPDGINIRIGNAPMGDAMGRSGIGGDLDRRYSERYGIALLTSVLTAATTYAMPVTNQNQQLVVESFGREVGGLSKTILQEHLNIKPVLTIPAGTRIMIMPLKDIWFPLPENGEILAQEVKR